jgi:hypothetical protein
MNGSERVNERHRKPIYIKLRNLIKHMVLAGGRPFVDINAVCTPLLIRFSGLLGRLKVDRRWPSLFAFKHLMALYNHNQSPLCHKLRVVDKISWSKDASTLRASGLNKNQYIISILMCQTFTPAHWQTIEHRWKD